MKELLIITLWKRFRDLLIKLSGVKGTFAIINTVIFVHAQNEWSFAGFLVGWIMLIGLREMEKFKGFLPTWKEK